METVFWIIYLVTVLISADRLQDYGTMPKATLFWSLLGPFCCVCFALQGLSALYYAAKDTWLGEGRMMYLCFTGADGSMEYRTGEAYYVNVEMYWNWRTLSSAPRISDYRSGRLKLCPYGSWNAFWDNWEKAESPVFNGW